MYRQNVVSALDISTTENSLLAAQTQLAQMKTQEVNACNNLSYTLVKGPTDGVVDTLPYRVGALVGASLPEPLTTVPDNSDMYAYFSMTENQLLGLIHHHGSKKGVLKQMPEIGLQLNDRPDYLRAGRIETINGVIDRATGTVSLRAVFPNRGGLLHNGDAEDVIVPTEKTGTLVIPQAATFEVQDKVSIYKVVDDKMRSAPVRMTRVNSGWEYIVESGLQTGDVIVAEGVRLLREGTEIKAVNEER